MKLSALILASVLIARIVMAQDGRYGTDYFYFVYPSNEWKMVTRPGDKLAWLVLSGETVADPNDASVSFHPVSSYSSNSLEEFVGALIDRNSKSGKNSLVTKTTFTTSRGVEGMKIEWAIPGDKFVDQFFFDAKNGHTITLGGIAPVSMKAKYDPVFDGFAKSLIIK